MSWTTPGNERAPRRRNKKDRAPILLGAHVSSAGGVDRAPARGAELGIPIIQVFTKPANRWAEREIDAGTAARFRAELGRHEIVQAGAHDSYLINLASPDPALQGRSFESFRCELERCDALGLDFLVSHPGNATDGARWRGLERNARAVRRALTETGAPVPVLFESTAGQGTALGSTFEELAELLELVGPEFADRVGVCIDTAHIHAAGYDLADGYDEVIEELDRLVGLHRLRLLHLNDSRTPRGSRVDRHEHIGRGHLGPAPFRRLMRDPRLRHVPKLIETPKGEDALRQDRANLARLRRYARATGDAVDSGRTER